jgi:hypothetical protein
MHVPDTLTEALSPRWLTAALHVRFPGVEVVGVTPGPVVDRISTNARFTIECAGGMPAGLSPNLCVKGYFNDIGRAARFIGEPEAYFYRDLAEETDVATLRPVYADVDPSTRHGVVITVDVVAHGAEFLDGRSPFTPDAAAQSLRELARLHAATWADPRWSTQAWLAPRMGKVFVAWGVRKTTSVIAANLHGPNGRGVPDEMRDEHRLITAYRALASALKSLPWCVIHGDPHVGNLFLDAKRRPCLLDWQLVQRGTWSVDVGYHIAATLPVDERRRAERDLLRHYLDCLKSFGVEPPAWDTAWGALRQGILHGFFLWAITTKVEPAIIEILLHRLGTAAADFTALSTIEVAR